MSVWGLLEKAAEVVGGPAVTVAVEGGKALAGLFGTSTVSGQATMSPEALVKMITTGPGAQGLDPERQENTDKAQVQNQIGDETRQHMTTLESAWTGGGADAAREKLQQATSPVAASSEAMTTNASTISGQMEVFTTLKNSLHTDVTDNPPQKSTWDNLTPWDTDTEDAINANNAKVQQNLDAYNSYTQASQSYAPQLKTDYGQVTDLSGNTFQIQQPATPSKSGSDGTQNTVGGSAYSNGSSAYSNSGASAASIPRKSTSSSGLSSTTGTNTTGQSGSLSGTLDDTTTAAGYTSPGSGGSSYSPTGSGGTSDYSSGGFGPLGGGGFGPMGGGGSGSGSSAGGYGSGSGSSTGAGSGTLSGGKATGGVAGESGATGAKAGAASAAGAAGRSGTSGMGAGRGGKGEGGEDAEHQRPSYLVEADPDSLFGTNEKTAPPVIGL